MKVQRKYSWKPDKKDHRDLLLAEPPVSITTILPKSADLRHLCPPIQDQGQLGSCTVHAGVGGAFDFLELKELRAKAPITASPEEFGQTFQLGSRLFAYYNERDLEGTVDQDSGGEIRDVVKAMAQWGVCPEALCPYDPDKFAEKPSAAAYAAALPHKISQYARVTSLQQMKQTLANGTPIIFGIYVYESFESDAVAASGMVPVPGPNEQCVGGHAVCMVGYDDAKQCVLVRNSWGASWGLAGYFWMPYAYIQNPNLATDFWVVKK